LDAFEKAVIIMDVHSIVKIVAVVVWLGAETCLILEDRARGKGKTLIEDKELQHCSDNCIVDAWAGRQLD
jgi:hypothetical protein